MPIVQVTMVEGRSEEQIAAMPGRTRGVGATGADCAGQQLARALAFARGIDSDNPRGLNKVTPTT